MGLEPTRTDWPDWRLETLAGDVKRLRSELADMQREERERRHRRNDLIMRAMCVTILALIIVSSVLAT